jgi:hypothetical protein
LELFNKGDEEYVLKLKRNLFGQRQAGRVWNKHLIEKLKKVGFVASQIDKCLFFRIFSKEFLLSQ